MTPAISLGTMIATLIIGIVIFAARSWWSRSDKRSRYRLGQTLFDLLSFGYAIWIMVLGLRLVMGAVDDLPDVPDSEQVLVLAAGAMGGIFELVGGILIALSLPRQDQSRVEVRSKAAAETPPPLVLTSVPSAPDPSTRLTDIVGSRSGKHRISRFYNIRPMLVWILVSLVILTFMCYLMLFVVELPEEFTEVGCAVLL